MARKEPQDYKRKRGPFEFKIGDVAGTLRHPTFAEMRHAASLENVEGMVFAFEECADSPATFEAILTLDQVDANELFTDWTESGKSSGSSS